MKLTAKYRAALILPLAAMLGAVLLTGCQSGGSANRRVYDRYAELVAERARARNTDQEPAAAAPAARPETRRDKWDRRPIPAKPAEPQPAPEPQPEPVPQPEPAPMPAPEPRPEPEAAEPPPVQVVMPPPAPAQEEAPVAIPAPDPQPEPAAAGIPPPENAGEDADVQGYTLKQGDAVQVFLRGIPNAEMIEGIVDERGMISMPLINEVTAAGMTASALARDIRRIYLDRGYYKNISVNVMVPTRYYFIQGEIRAPGRFQILSATRVSQAIAAAGGYTEFASGRVEVKRDGRIHKTIRNARRLDRTPEDDIQIEPDDIIVVRRSLW